MDGWMDEYIILPQIHWTKIESCIFLEHLAYYLSSASVIVIIAIFSIKY